MREFHISDVLSVTTGKLVSTRRMEGVYDILNYMTGDTLWTHQLPRANDECAPWLLRQHPALAEVDASAVRDPATAEAFVVEMVARFGERLSVAPIPKDDHVRRDPVEEAVAMVGAERVIVVDPSDFVQREETRADEAPERFTPGGGAFGGAGASDSWDSGSSSSSDSSSSDSGGSFGSDAGGGGTTC
jgi:hypothetical protein